MSATIGFALSVGLVWWEQANGYSIRNLGSIAVGFAIIILAYVMYHAIGKVGGSWAGAGIALGASILIAKVLGLKIPLDSEVVLTVMIVALIVGLLSFMSHRHYNYPKIQYSRPFVRDIRHDMSDLYRNKRLSKKLSKGLQRVRHDSADLNERPEETGKILQQLKRMLPAEGWLTQRMAQLRAKAHRIRNGHIARLEETRHLFAKLPTSAKKTASAELASRYRKIVGIDTRLERLENAVTAYEKRIRDLTAQAKSYAANYNYQKLHDCLKTAEKLQKHNTKLLKIIVRTEAKLIRAAMAVVDKTREVKKNEDKNTRP
jgi:endonuclease III